MGIELLYAVGLLGILMIIIGLKGITKFLNTDNYNMDITVDKNVY